MLEISMGNEEALCEALIRRLEAEAGILRADVSFPERDNSGPPVEVRLRIGDQRIAIEHTLVEPFPLAIRTGMEFVTLTAEIKRRLHGHMPKPGSYLLVFPIHPTKGKPRQTHEELRQKLTEWIIQAGNEMHEECPERKDRHHCPLGYRGTRSTEIEGISMRLSLQVHWSEGGHHDGALFISRTVGEDVESQRRVRMSTALEKKLPKLSRCAAEGDTTFLILEWSDIALSNEIVVAQALEKALANRDDCPDYVFLADTTTDSWHFFQPIIKGTFSIDMKYIEIDRPAPAAVS
jgi:hypothetical protein